LVFFESSNDLGAEPVFPLQRLRITHLLFARTALIGRISGRALASRGLVTALHLSDA